MEKMSEWKKSSQEAIERFEQLLPEGPNVVKKKMFSYPCMDRQVSKIFA